MTILLLLACAKDPGWTEASAIAPTLAKIDTDHDGAVSAAEWEAVSFHAVPFAAVDTDKSGGIDEAELLTLLVATDPSTMTMPRAGPQTKRGHTRTSAIKAEPAAALNPLRVRHERALTTRYALLAIQEELQAAAPDLVLPTRDEVLRTADSGDLRTVESRALLARMEAAADSAKLDFPASLRASELAKEEVVASAPVEAPVIDEPRVKLGPDGRPEAPH